MKFTGGRISEIQRYGQEWDSIVEMPDGEYVRHDDVSDLLAERDPTPVDAEWLDRVMGPGIVGIEGRYTEWLSECGLCEVTLFRDGLTLLSHKGHILKNRLTRGDVLTALRLFGGCR